MVHNNSDNDKGITWHGIDRQVQVVPDLEQSSKHGSAPKGHERYQVQVIFTSYGYNTITMERVNRTTDTYVIVRNLSHRAAEQTRETLSSACNQTFSQGYNARRVGN